jgi:hypothetical protein
MDNKIKLLIGVIIVIFAVSVSLSYLLYNPNNVSNNSSNVSIQINNSNNSTINTTKTTKSVYITKQQAINSVKKYGTSTTRYTAKLITNDGDPYYLITAYDNDPDSEYYGWAIGGAKVDAITGRLIYGMG